MTEIIYNYRLMHRCYRFNSLMTMQGMQIIIERDHGRMSELVKACDEIDEAVEIIKTESELLQLPLARFPRFYIEVFIPENNDVNTNRFLLSHDLKRLQQKELEAMYFEPHITYDIEDIRSEAVRSLECRLLLECKSKEEQVALIRDYLKKPERRYKKWPVKPKKLYLFHTYGETPVEFDIE